MRGCTPVTPSNAHSRASSFLFHTLFLLIKAITFPAAYLNVSSSVGGSGLLCYEGLTSPRAAGLKRSWGAGYWAHCRSLLCVSTSSHFFKFQTSAPADTDWSDSRGRLSDFTRLPMEPPKAPLSQLKISVFLFSHPFQNLSFLNLFIFLLEIFFLMIWLKVGLLLTVH